MLRPKLVAEGKLQMLLCLFSLALLLNPIEDIFKKYLNNILYVVHVERKQAFWIIHLKLPKGVFFVCVHKSDIWILLFLSEEPNLFMVDGCQEIIKKYMLKQSAQTTKLHARILYPGLDPGNTVNDALTWSTPKLIILIVNLHILCPLLWHLAS